jgi:hypothetical protein
MSYIIIPIATILYIWWSYETIKDFKNEKWKDSTDWFMTLHVGVIGTYVLFKIVEFIIF